MTRVPTLVQGIARTAIYRLAVEKGHSVITSDLLDEAMDRGGSVILPPGRYIVSGLTINRPVMLAGTPGQTVLAGGKDRAILSIESAEDVVLSGIGFEGGGDNQVEANGAALHIDTCSFQKKLENIREMILLFFRFVVLGEN